MAKGLPEPDAALLAWIEEALSPMGPVSFRRMMGGATLYLDGTIFAILHEGELWFKSDAEADPVWDAAGHTDKFTMVMKDGWVDVMNYRRAPDEVHDDAEAMQHWAGVAVAAGARRPVKKPRKSAPPG